MLIYLDLHLITKYTSTSDVTTPIYLKVVHSFSFLSFFLSNFPSRIILKCVLRLHSYQKHSKKVAHQTISCLPLKDNRIMRPLLTKFKTFSVNCHLNAGGETGTRWDQWRAWVKGRVSWWYDSTAWKRRMKWGLHRVLLMCWVTWL